VSAVLSVDGLVLRRGERAILDGASLSVERGDFVALLGESGGGKTTLLRAIAGLVRFHGGAIDVDGVRLGPGPLPTGPAARDLRGKVGLVFQGANLFGHLDVLRNVTLAPLHVLGLGAGEAGERARGLLAILGLSGRTDAFPSELSGGEAQRVAIARALAMEPPLLLMDEPTAALDPGRRRELGEQLLALNARGATLLMATHDLEFASAFGRRTVVLAEGRIASGGAGG
jgi:ABC-type polar amino acid transport system ATPase subunit